MNADVDPGLLAAAAAAEPGPAPAGPPGAAPPAPAVIAASAAFRQEAKETWQCIALLSLRFPSLKPIYTADVIERLADVWGPVFERHNIDMGKLMIYFSAGMATLPVAANTWEAIRHDRAVERAQVVAPPAAPAKTAPTSPPAGSTEFSVQPGPGLTPAPSP